MKSIEKSNRPRLSSEFPGLDDILLGGLRRDPLFLFEGSPGAGKTTLALQFLREARGPGKKASTSHCRRLRQK